MSKPLDIVFFGTPNAAKVVLESLLDSQHNIVCVLTQPDKRRSRGKSLSPTEVKVFAEEKNVDVFTPSTKQEIEEIVCSLKADIGVVVAYGKILSENIINHFEYGCVNVHYSILPRWRGAAPIERAILEGDQVTGISIMKLTKGLDEGPIYASRQFDISDSATTLDVYNAMNTIAGDLLMLVLDSIEGQEPYEQQGEVTYAKKLENSDFYFDRDSSVKEIDRKLRAGVNLKGAHTKVFGDTFWIREIDSYELTDNSEGIGTIDRQGKLICRDGNIYISKIQVPSKPPMDFSQWINGVPKDQIPLKIGQ